MACRPTQKVLAFRKQDGRLCGVRAVNGLADHTWRGRFPHPSALVMTSYFSALIDFVSAHSHYAYFAIFMLALSEAIPVVGTVVPGSTLIIGISAIATEANANPSMLLVAATVGAITGDGLSFWLGQRYHQRILHFWPLHQYPQFIARSERFIARYGAASVFLARFTAVVRAFVPLVSGILRMSPRQFYAANILSAFAWAPAHVFPGVLIAMALRLTNASAEGRAILVIGGLIVASIIAFATHSYLKRKQSAALE